MEACKAKTKFGRGCRNKALDGSVYCHVHKSWDNNETNTNKKLSSRISFSIKKSAGWLEKHPVIKIVGVIVLVVTGIQVTLSIMDRKSELMARSWQIVTTKSSGNSGKVEALEYLYENGANLRGVDLSCRANGGGWDDKSLKCERPTYLTGLKLPERSQYSGVDLVSADFTGTNMDYAFVERANLAKAKFVSTRLYGATLDKSHLFYVDFTNADLATASLKDASLVGAIFTKSKISEVDFSSASFTGAILKDANISKSNFKDSEIEQPQLDEAWAWSDRPPINLPSKLKIKHLCDPKLRPAYYGSKLFEAHLERKIQGMPPGC